MPRYFVSDPPVPIADPQGSDNVIMIKSKMDVETDAKVKGEMFIPSADGKTMEMRPGANEMALLIHNIVSWSGSDLGLVPCNAANIRKLDPTEPHIARVLAEIVKRNRRGAPKNPLSAADGTHTKSGASDSRPSATERSQAAEPSASGILKSASPNGSAGPPIRSDDSILTTSRS